MCALFCRSRISLKVRVRHRWPRHGAARSNCPQCSCWAAPKAHQLPFIDQDVKQLLPERVRQSRFDKSVIKAQARRGSGRGGTSSTPSVSPLVAAPLDDRSAATTLVAAPLDDGSAATALVAAPVDKGSAATTLVAVPLGGGCVGAVTVPLGGGVGGGGGGGGATLSACCCSLAQANFLLCFLPPRWLWSTYASQAMQW